MYAMENDWGVHVPANRSHGSLRTAEAADGFRKTQETTSYAGHPVLDGIEGLDWPSHFIKPRLSSAGVCIC